MTERAVRDYRPGDEPGILEVIETTLKAGPLPGIPMGRELLRWAIGYARANRAGPIELNVEAANERALELYRRTGFTPEVEWREDAIPTGA